jgi:two-component system phosphate regulon response regulator PhoB
MAERILVVEDEEGIRQLISDALTPHGFDVVEARNGAAALAVIETAPPQLAIVDWMMPQTSGIELIRQLRSQETTRALPIIMLTARSTENDTIEGLEAGADDYMHKPFSTRELITRVRALLRRSVNHATSAVLQAGRLTLDPDAHRVQVENEVIDLAQTEFRLLHFFISHPDRVFSRAQLLDHVWGVNHFVDERTVDVHILRLRKALRAHGIDDLIDTVRGAGYRMTLKADDT